jgi:hypothetical protein
MLYLSLNNYNNSDIYYEDNDSDIIDEFEESTAEYYEIDN